MLSLSFVYHHTEALMFISTNQKSERIPQYVFQLIIDSLLREKNAVKANEHRKKYW